MPRLIWKPWAPNGCRVFTWLLHQNRLWTGDRFISLGWPANGSCIFCQQAAETGEHLFRNCSKVYQWQNSNSAVATLNAIHVGKYRGKAANKLGQSSSSRKQRRKGKRVASALLAVFWAVIARKKRKSFSPRSDYGHAEILEHGRRKAIDSFLEIITQITSASLQMLL